MCVIISSPYRQHRPSLDTLRACERLNPHGSGIAWVQDKKAQWLKGLSADSLSDLLDILDGPVVIHFRIATAGGRRPELCHPFPISPTAPLKTCGQAGAVLFHNGHWAKWETFQREEGIKFEAAVSDSRVIATAVHRYGRAILETIPCRFAILSRHGVELFGEWSAPQDDGCRYSNLHWQPKTHLDRTHRAGEPGKAAKVTTQPRPVLKQPNLLDMRQLRAPGLVREAMACFGD